MLRHDPKLAGDFRQFAIARAVEQERHLTFAGPLCLHDMAIVRRIERIVLLEHIEREDHVLGRHRAAIVPFGLRTQAIGDGRKVRRMAHAIREQSV